jgi:tRNA/tmRNA/rRNA uracil-C5-methylase (TrmA/RlmC/RlmD family)
VADARVNLSGCDARIVRVDVDKFRPQPADIVVADPSRRGLGRAAVEVIDRTATPLVVLVSCDAGALGRDARLLAQTGFTCESADLVDAFPQTSHVEVVTRWVRPRR